MDQWDQEQQEQIKSNWQYMEYADHRVSQFFKEGISPITSVQNKITDSCGQKSHTWLPLDKRIHLSDHQQR